MVTHFTVGDITRNLLLATRWTAALSIIAFVCTAGRCTRSARPKSIFDAPKTAESQRFVRSVRRGRS